MKLTLLLTVCLALLLLCACQKNNQPPVEQSDLLHHSFVLQSLDGQNLDFQPLPFMAFGEGMRVYGKTCNNFTGQGELKEGKLWVRNMASTRMLCVDQPLNQLEMLLAQMLDSGADISLQGQQLTLRGHDHTLVFRLRDLVE